MKTEGTESSVGHRQMQEEEELGLGMAKTRKPSVHVGEERVDRSSAGSED